MTGDSSPAGSSPSPGAAPEMRASHEDRDRAVDILRIAAGDGRLAADELDERLEAALTARTVGELLAEGRATLDFTEALISHPTLRIEIDVRGGLRREPRPYRSSAG
jgi:hypothetical protein